MSQSFETPPPGPPPQKSGMSTLMIVLIVGGLLLLLCCGACGGCMYFGAGEATKMRDVVMAKVSVNQAVKDKLGEPLEAGFPNFKMVNQNVTLDFSVTGPKGTGTVHAEGISGANGFEPNVITVTTSDNQVIDVNAKTDPTDMEFPTDLDDAE